MTMRISLAILILITFVSCGKPVDLDEIEKRFKANEDKFEKLTSMSKKDFRGDLCFSVGTDNIGEYWESSGKWSHSKDYQTKMDIEQVLKNVGISQEKYAEYSNLFSQTKTERVTYCPTGKFYIMAHRTGLGISGCLLDIVKGKTPPMPYGKRNNGEDFMEIRPLKEGWWVEYKCT